MAIRWADGNVSLSPSVTRIRLECLQVGPLTNLTHTQCFSTHLTTFAGGFLALPNPISWNYVFAEPDLHPPRVVYLMTVIGAAIVLLVLMLYVRSNDEEDTHHDRATVRRKGLQTRVAELDDPHTE